MLFTLLWSLFHWSKSHSCGCQGNFVQSYKSQTPSISAWLRVEYTLVILICQNNLFLSSDSTQARRMSKKKGMVLGCGYILITSKAHRLLPAEVGLFQWEQKCPDSHIIESTWFPSGSWSSKIQLEKTFPL